MFQGSSEERSEGVGRSGGLPPMARDGGDEPEADDRHGDGVPQGRQRGPGAHGDGEQRLGGRVTASTARGGEREVR